MNKRMKKKKGLEKPSFNERLSNLLDTCIKNDLAFEYTPRPYLVDIRNPAEGHRIITRGYIKDWEYETPEDTITRMEKEIKEHVDRN